MKPSRPCLPSSVVSFVAVFVAVWVAGCPAESGEPEPDPEPECAFGTLRAESPSVDVDACLEQAEQDADNPLVLNFALEGVLFMRVDVFGELAPLPLTLDEFNSSTFLRFNDGGGEWQVVTGAIGGTPIGSASTRIDEIDGNVIHGRCDGVAAPNDDNPVFEGVFITLTF